MTSPDAPETYPLLPLREVIVYPGMTASLVVGRARSLAALDHAKTHTDCRIFVVAQRNGDQLEPGPEDLFRVGTLVSVESSELQSNGTTRLSVRGLARATATELVFEEEAIQAAIGIRASQHDITSKMQVLTRQLDEAYKDLASHAQKMDPETLSRVEATTEWGLKTDRMIDSLPLPFQTRQQLLEALDLQKRLELLLGCIHQERERLRIEHKEQQRIHKGGSSSERPPGLNEGAWSRRPEARREQQQEWEEIRAALEAKNLPAAVKKRTERELRRLKQMNAMSGEAGVVRNYLDWMTALPWELEEKASPELARASEILEEDHYGLDEVKERIVEYLAVSTLVEKMRGPILCLVGPPGCGKTSLARSIARATEREFVKISLAGVRDEAEIRGHRRTYIGAMPGKLIQGIRRAESMDCVMLLDEVDKMASDMRGDPSHALLEVLDPEQNHSFQDHFLEVDYDLSHVTFVCTANQLSGIPLPLKDRLEILEVSGYSEEEKMAIAKQYLLPKQTRLHGLKDTEVTVEDPVLATLIRDYTRESGVRHLDRQLAKICRKTAHKVATAKRRTSQKPISKDRLSKLLGPAKYHRGARPEQPEIGVVQGLAVSPWGGEVLTVEVMMVPGTGKVTLTGRLGDWLKESAHTAITCLRARAETLQLDPNFHETLDAHIHYPGNPLKTDGPSAGIAMATALASALTGRPVRSDTAMTGEISLRGRVLPIGGLRAKVLAAHREGISRVLIPTENIRQLQDIPTNITKEMDIIPVSSIEQVLKNALK